MHIHTGICNLYPLGGRQYEKRRLIIHFIRHWYWYNYLMLAIYLYQVYDMEGKSIDLEILPVFGREKTMVSPNTFELTFVAELGSLNLKNYMLKYEHVE